MCVDLILRIAILCLYLLLNFLGSRGSVVSGQTLCALLNTFQGLPLNFENCRDKIMIFFFTSHLVLSWKSLLWVALTPCCLPSCLLVEGLDPCALPPVPFPFPQPIPLSCLALHHHTLLLLITAKFEPFLFLSGALFLGVSLQFSLWFPLGAGG